jgi:Protein of unknown function (DUF642)
MSFRFRLLPPAGLLAVAAAMLLAGPAGAQNIVQNGSFEEPAIAPGSFTNLPSIPGWTDSTGCGIEIQSGVAGTPADGAQLVELDSNCSSVISQTLATQPGAAYDLQFQFSARPGVADNHVQVRWNGTVVADLTADGTGLSDTQWTKHSVIVVATGASTTLSFADLSVSDSLGTYIDDVQAARTGATAIPALSTAGIAALGLLLAAAGALVAKTRPG